MTADVAVFVHGYRGAPRAKATHRVWDDRLTAAARVVETYDSLGLSVDLYMLGQLPDRSRPVLYDHATESWSELVEQFDCTTLPHVEGMNTYDELSVLCETLAEQPDLPSLIISVSSKDHAPRIQRYWAELRDEDKIPTHVVSSVVGSDDSYALDPRPPVTLERARYQPVCDALAGLPHVRKAEIDAFAAELDRLVDQYSSESDT